MALICQTNLHTLAFVVPFFKQTTRRLVCSPLCFAQQSECPLQRFLQPRHRHKQHPSRSGPADRQSSFERLASQEPTQLPTVAEVGSAPAEYVVPEVLPTADGEQRKSAESDGRWSAADRRPPPARSAVPPLLATPLPSLFQLLCCTLVAQDDNARSYRACFATIMQRDRVLCGQADASTTKPHDPLTTIWHHQPTSAQISPAMVVQGASSIFFHLMLSSTP